MKINLNYRKPCKVLIKNTLQTDDDFTHTTVKSVRKSTTTMAWEFSIEINFL